MIHVTLTFKMTKEIKSHAKQRHLGASRQQKCYLAAHGAPKHESFDLKVKAIEGNGCRKIEKETTKEP